MKGNHTMILIAHSPLHGDRPWRRVGSRDHTTRDGRHIILAEWESGCTICGKPFRATTPGNVSTVEQSKTFQMVTCEAHRMTPANVARLRYAKPADRPAIFEAMKRDMIA
jgi:hypothetical protein